MGGIGANIESTFPRLKSPRTRSIAACSIGLAFALWGIIFVLRPFNFWLMMSLRTTLLALSLSCLVGH